MITFDHEKTFRDRGYRILLMALKKPIEITEHPIEIHGKICSIEITADGKYRTVEWVKAKDEKEAKKLLKMQSANSVFILTCTIYKKKTI